MSNTPLQYNLLCCDSKQTSCRICYGFLSGKIFRCKSILVLNIIQAYVPNKHENENTWADSGRVYAGKRVEKVQAISAVYMEIEVMNVLNTFLACVSMQVAMYLPPVSTVFWPRSCLNNFSREMFVGIFCLRRLSRSYSLRV